MNAKHVTRTLVVLLIAAMLGGAYVIVEKNGSTKIGARQEAPSGFIH
jgi:hypothetical protein